jgi:Cysteine rich repeat
MAKVDLRTDPFHPQLLPKENNMTSKSLIALAFVCLAPAVSFAETAPAKVTAPAAPAAVTAPAVSAPATATVKAAPSATTTATPASPAAPTAAAIPADGQGSKRWKDCAGDVQKFCATVEKGKGAVRNCLESHSAELTPACKTGLAEHAAAKDSEKAGEKPAADKVVK